MKHLIILITLCLLCFSDSALADVPQLINVQSLLSDSAGTPVTDSTYSISFTIYDAASGGTVIWTEVQSVTTTGGLFSVHLGAVDALSESDFDGSPRYLGIAVGADPELTPRAQLVTVPYAFRTATLNGANGGELTGSVVWSNDLAQVDSPMMYLFDPTPAGPATRNIFAHSPSLQDLGLAYNTSNQSFEFRFGGPAMTIEMVTHRVGIGTNAPQSELDVNGTIRAGGVELGVNPTRSGFQSTVGGGGLNTASANWATSAGGQQNTAGGEYSTSSGGHFNSATGNYSTIPGGRQNEATGAYSFAAGRRAKANHAGSFVWADSTDADFASTGSNQFLIRAGGGVGIGTASPNSQLQIEGSFATSVALISSHTTLDGTHCVVLADATSGAVTVTLPSAVGIMGRRYTIKRTSVAGSDVTVSTNGLEQLDLAATSRTLTGSNQFITVVSDGSDWWIIGVNQ